jgi:hypothetical protein
MAANASAGNFYRYQAPDGRVHITNAVDELPPEARASAQPVELDTLPVTAAKATPSARTVHGAVAKKAAARGVDATSFVLGFGSALALAAALFLFAKGSRRVLRVVIGTALVCLLGAAYLGLLRHSVDSAGGPLATPGDLVEDARSAVRAAERREREQQRLLDDIERESKR